MLVGDKCSSPWEFGILSHVYVEPLVEIIHKLMVRYHHWVYVATLVQARNTIEVLS